MGEASHPGPPGQGLRRAAKVSQEVVDDFEAALTRIDSSGTEDEPLVRPLRQERRAQEVDCRGFTGGGRLRRLRVVSSSPQDVGSTTIETASSRAIIARHGSPQVTATVPDSRSTWGAERGQRDRPESQGQASSGVKRMVHNRFEILVEEDENGVDHPDFFGAESDTESLAARASQPRQPSSKSHRCIPTI